MWSPSYFAVLTTLLTFSPDVNGQTPKFIKKCSRSDPNINSCIINAANIALPYILNGDADLNLPNIFEYHFEEFHLNTNQNINYNFKNGRVFACQNVKATSAKMDFQKKTLNINIHFPFANWYLDFTATSSVDENIHETGRVNISFVNIDFTYEGKLVSKIMNRVKHLQMELGGKIDFKADIKFDPFKLDHQGCSALSVKETETLEESYKSIEKGLFETVEKFADVLWVQIFNKILAKIPEDDVFLP